MFRSFFLERRWFLWSIGGSIVIILALYASVRIDVRINDWFKEFYDLLQKALEKPNSVSFGEFLDKCMIFFKWAAIYVILAIFTSFFSSHFVYRWRKAMNYSYINNWDKLRNVEGASQRIQEDTMRFANIMESLGEDFVHAFMTLVAFLPILWGLSKYVKELPWIGYVPHSLVWLAILLSVFGTGILALAGIKLPQLHFNNQMVEAAYRKELVLGEDNDDRADSKQLLSLFKKVQNNYFKLYWHYLYFNLVKYSYLQATVILPYIALAPSILSGAITLGIMQQILNAFGKVKDSFHILVRSWTTIVELISIYKRLNSFEKVLMKVKN